VEIQKCRSDAIDAFRQVAEAFGKRDRLIVVGGTGEYLKPLVANADRISTVDVDQVLDFLSTIRAAELSQRFTIPVARAKVLPAGIAIVRALADLTAPTVIEGARSGIRTGLLLAAFAGEI
jgi:exopolyphosphatase/pppGpp-phosphohydrolase